MEALAEEMTSDFESLGLTPAYDPETNNFQSDYGVPVRHVVNKKLTAQHGLEGEIYDDFTGVIDGVTGEPLHGTRTYTLSGEVYEGPFSNGGIRDGPGAIVKNIHLPEPIPSMSEESLFQEELVGPASTLHNLTFSKANFFGSYTQDQPHHGTLVTDTFTYRGHFVNSRFHGLNEELIHSSGYKYNGEFQGGLFHGTGKEYDPATGEYHGEFFNGMRHGTGTFKSHATINSDGSSTTQDESSNEDESENHSEQLEKDEWEEEGDLFDFTVDPETEEDPSNVATTTAEKEQLPSKPEVEPPASVTRYVYSGQYRCNQKHGEGNEWTITGEVYTGQFCSGQRHGHGSLRNTSTGIVYDGQWRAGSPQSGIGWQIRYPSGDLYVGEVTNYSPHGYGIYKYSTGQVHTGDWRFGRRHGNGICSDANGTEFTGEWKEGVVVSKSRLEETDGTLCEIAETLRLDVDVASNNDNSSSPSAPPSTPPSSSPTQKQDTPKKSPSPSKHDKQLSFLKQAMSKSLETSLHLLAQKSVEYDGSLASDRPRPQRKSPKRRGNDTSSSNPPKARAELHTYANGDTYLGALDADTHQRTGYGVYVSRSTGCTYTGQFHRNLRQGYGILIHTKGRYAGEFFQDRKHGLGTLILSDTSSYHGNFRNGAFDGKGTLCEKNGTVYVGNWKAGLKHGDGMETLSDGRVYQGQYYKGRKDGLGTLLEKSGGKVIYRGMWRDGMFHGEGVLTVRADTESESEKAAQAIIQYKGAFANGRRHGYGEVKREIDGTVCKGMFSLDEAVPGKWRIVKSDGSIYSGQAIVIERPELFESGAVESMAIPDGFGTLKYENGDVYAGNFEKGKRSGKGVCIFASGDKFEGDWKEDSLEKDGCGTLTLADGTVHQYHKTVYDYITAKRPTI